MFFRREDNKTPYTRHGVHDATTDRAAIERMVSRWQDANLAVATGDASGIDVLDIDNKGTFNGWDSVGRLEAEGLVIPPTPRVITPSGAHLWFRRTPGVIFRNRVGLKRWLPDRTCVRYEGIDVRSTGSSVAVPPSRKPDGRAYVWDETRRGLAPPPMPPWLIDLLTSEPPRREAKEESAIESPERVARYVAAAINGECRALASMSANTGRNQRLFTAACRLGEFVGAKLLSEDRAWEELEAAARECGLISDDGLHSVNGTIRSGLRRGIDNPWEAA